MLLSDPTTNDGHLWGSEKVLGKKSIGCIRSTVIIDPNGKVIKHWKRVPKAEAHPAKVLEFIATATADDQ